MWSTCVPVPMSTVRPGIPHPQTEGDAGSCFSTMFEERVSEIMNGVVSLNANAWARETQHNRSI